MSRQIPLTHACNGLCTACSDELAALQELLMSLPAAQWRCACEECFIDELGRDGLELKIRKLAAGIAAQSDM